MLPDKENRDDNIEEINGMEDKYKMTEVGVQHFLVYLKIQHNIL